MMDNYSLSDIAAATDGGFGGNNSLLYILLFAIIFGWGGNGGWGGNRGNVATTEDLASGFNFNSLQEKTNDILAAVNGVNQNLGNAVCQMGYENLKNINGVQQQISDCCCTTQRAIDGVKFDMANYNAATNANTMAVGQKILDKLCGMEMAQKDAIIAQQGQRIAALEMDARFCGIPRINPYGYGIYQYPTCNPCWTQQNGSY